MSDDSNGTDTASLNRWCGLLGIGCLLFFGMTASNKGIPPSTALAHLLVLMSGIAGILTYQRRRQDGSSVSWFWLILPILLVVAFFWILLLGGIIQILVSILVP